jgi:geranylgeranyl reductase family protein
MRTYDVVVVGGGPVGSYSAHRLADLGLEVALYEKSPAASKHVVCTGIVGSEAFKRYDLPEECSVHLMDRVRFLSPSGLMLEYREERPFARVIDRTRFDAALLERAWSAGVEVELGAEVRRVEPGRRFVRITAGAGKQSVRARAVIVATGVSYDLHRSLGLGVPPGFLMAVQTEARTEETSTTEVHLDGLSEGAFGWTVPGGPSIARVGALAGVESARRIGMLVDKMLSGRQHTGRTELEYKPIAHGPVGVSVSDRALAVGEAAGQIKTTTGGGVFYGLLCAEVAVDVLAGALRRGDLSGRALSGYERLWRDRIEGDLRSGLEARRLVRDLRPETLDTIFRFIQRSGTVRRLIKGRMDFDRHADLLLLAMRLLRPMVKRPAGDGVRDGNWSGRILDGLAQARDSVGRFLV